MPGVRRRTLHAALSVLITLGFVTRCSSAKLSAYNRSRITTRVVVRAYGAAVLPLHGVHGDRGECSSGGRTQGSGAARHRAVLHNPLNCVEKYRFAAHRRRRLLFREVVAARCGAPAVPRRGLRCSTANPGMQGKTTQAETRPAQRLRWRWTVRTPGRQWVCRSPRPSSFS